MAISVSGRLVSLGAYGAAVDFGSFGARLEIGPATTIQFDDADGIIDVADLGATTVTIDGDNQGPVTALEFRTFTQDGSTDSFSLVAISRENVADLILLQVDPATGALVVGGPPAGTGYAAGATFDPVDIGPLDPPPPPNRAPTPVDDTAGTAEDTAVTIDVLGNDTDPDGDTLTITGVGAGTLGSAAIDNGQIVYTPNANATGSDSFTYTVSDGELTNTATVTVAVSAENDAPVAVDDTAGTGTDTAVTIDVLSNDADVDGDTLTIESATDGTLGTTSVSGQQIIYTPNAGAIGPDAFTYTISDGTVTDTATVNVTISDVNVAPDAVDDTASTAEDTSVAIRVLDNDLDANGDTLTITDVTAAGAGLAVLQGPFVIYRPNTDFTGTDTFTYTLSDGELTDTATVTVTVDPANDPPAAIDDTAITDEDTAVSIDVLANDTDVDGDSLSIASATDGTLGTTSVVGQQIVYTPNADAFGSDTFTYDITDGAETRSATVSVSIAEVPDTIVPGDGNTMVPGGPGTETFVLGNGSYSLSGPVQSFYNDTVQNFGLDDQFVFGGQQIGRDMISVAQGSAIISIDPDGDGTPNGTFTLEGDFAGGDFMSVVNGGDSVLTFETFLPALAEKQALDPGLVNGIINQAFLTGNGTQDMQITLRDIGAADFDNVVGAYEVNAAGEIVDTKILFANANADKTASTVLTDVEAGHQVGFFVVQDAAAWLARQASGDSFSFVNSAGAAGNISDGADLALAVNGVASGEQVWHSFDDALNSDGVQHALSGVDVGGNSLTVGFEDKTGGGDMDYQDVAFSIEFI